MFSLSLMRRSSTASLHLAAASSPSSATRWAISSARRTKSGDLATESVSHLSSTRAAASPARATATAPCTFSRPERSPALPRPFSLSQRMAASKSPSHSVRARLASIMPAPLTCRRRCTSLALNSAMP